MRKEFSEFVELCRVRKQLAHLPPTKRGDRSGVFSIPRPPMVKNLLVVVSDGEGWADMGMPLPVFEHVSVSHPDRIPFWDEMCFVKSLFFEDEECVVQYHVPVSMHVNFAKHTLHLWRAVGVGIVMPPRNAV